jgi:hypothetical protein
MDLWNAARWSLTYMTPVWRRKIKNLLSNSNLFILLRPGKPARPAPAELPQDRKVARVGGCSGAMFGLPLFLPLIILIGGFQ